MEQTAQEGLTTAEELLLLAIDPRSGALHSHPTYRLPAALAGAVLLDLFAEGSVTLVDDTVVAGTGGDISRYGAAVERFHKLPPHGVPWWVETLGFAGKETKGATIARLAEKGVIAIDTVAWLPPFPRTRYRLVDPGIRSGVANKLLTALRADTPPDTRSVALAVMADACGLVTNVAPRSERRGLSRRVSGFLHSETVSNHNTSVDETKPTLIAQVFEAVCAPSFTTSGGAN